LNALNVHEIFALPSRNIIPVEKSDVTTSISTSTNGARPIQWFSAIAKGVR